MRDNCEMGECTEDRTYDAPITVPDPFPEETGSGSGSGSGDGSGDGGTYVLPVATSTRLGGIKSTMDDFGVHVDSEGKAMLANASGLKHDLDNYHELAKVVGKMTDEEVETITKIDNAARAPQPEGQSYTVVQPEEVFDRENGLKQTAMGRANKLPTAVLYNVSETDYNQDDITLHFVAKDLATGGDSAIVLPLTGAEASVGGALGKAGIMTITQATQLAALAEAYRNTTQGIVLYEGTASTNYVTLRESAFDYDHLVVVSNYMGMGSSAIEETVSTEFYPNGEVKAFQINATDITAGAAPKEDTLQDIWQLSADGTELDLVSALKSEKMSGNLTVTIEPTSIFTIVKVVGYGKKV